MHDNTNKYADYLKLATDASNVFVHFAKQEKQLGTYTLMCT